MNKQIKINDLTYYKIKLGYKVGSEEVVFDLYTTDPLSIDIMINKLVDFKAEKIAKNKIKQIISEKVGNLLESI